MRVTGFGLVEAYATNQALVYVASGCIRSVSNQNLPERLHTLFAGITQIIDQYQPQQVAIEEVFVNLNPKSTLLLGQARGALIAAAVQRGLPVSEYTALQIKQGVVGYGHAAKHQVQEMVKRLLQLSLLPAADQADALACALRHANSQPPPGQLSTTVGGVASRSRRRGMLRLRSLPAALQRKVAST